MIAKEMNLPWRAVEAMHWQMGAEEMAQRANVALFQTHVTPASLTATGAPKNAGGASSSASSAAPGRGLKRKTTSKSPTLGGGDGSDSSVGDRGTALSDVPMTVGSVGSYTRARRSSSAAYRRRNDSKISERDSRDLYGTVEEEQEGHSPGGVSLAVAPGGDDGPGLHETPGSNGDGSMISARDWKDRRREASASEQPRSRSLSSIRSGGSVHPPSSSIKVKHELG
jgi:hypothetical protein